MSQFHIAPTIFHPNEAINGVMAVARVYCVNCSQCIGDGVQVLQYFTVRTALGASDVGGASLGGGLGWCRV